MFLCKFYFSIEVCGVDSRTVTSINFDRPVFLSGVFIIFIIYTLIFINDEAATTVAVATKAEENTTKKII